ncbi:MAG: hypothetical protein ACM3XM_07540 [Mycobacterium leprae]
MIPALSPLLTVADALRRAGIPFALGGSGLLHSLGLVSEVHDWDLTTDSPLPVVAAALGDLPWVRAAHGEQRYATDYRLAIAVAGVSIDLMGSFAIRTEAGVCHLPTIPVSTWEGVPVGSPEVWAVAYRLMGRSPKADLLSAYLRQRGADRQVVARLLQEPLPADVREEVARW